MEIVSSGIALAALLLSIYATVTARTARLEAKSVAASRDSARQSLGGLLDEANALLEEMRAERSRGQDVGSNDSRIVDWEHKADGAIRLADPASIGKFHEPLGPKYGIRALEERRRRLEAILDSL
jgi:hypothetical protein